MVITIVGVNVDALVFNEHDRFDVSFVKLVKLVVVLSP